MGGETPAFANPHYLVETDWLEAHLGDADLRVFDCTTHLIPDPKSVYRVESGRADWEKGHIAGAGFLDLQGELSDPESRLRFTMPSAARFAEAVSRHGVDDDSRVVLYSAVNIWWATRLWWMFRAFGFERAAVLNGGFEKWRAEGRPLSSEPPSYPPGRFTARPRPGLIVGKDEVLAALGAEDACVVNALSPRQHSGESDIHYGRPGRIAGSVNVPASRLTDKETNAYLAPGELASMFAAAGVMAAERVITYCGGGIAASNDAFVLTLLGHDDVALYDASLSEWAADEMLPMETG